MFALTGDSGIHLGFGDNGKNARNVRDACSWGAARVSSWPRTGRSRPASTVDRDVAATPNVYGELLRKRAVLAQRRRRHAGRLTVRHKHLQALSSVISVVLGVGSEATIRVCPGRPRLRLVVNLGAATCSARYDASEPTERSRRMAAPRGFCFELFFKKHLTGRPSVTSQ